MLQTITPAIINDEMFDLTHQAIAQAKLSRPVKPNAAYLLTSFTKCPKCGSPIGGTTLNGKYRYYKCRGSVPTATRGKVCDAGYIKADQLEHSVWTKVIDMLSSPVTLLRTLLNENDNQSDEIIHSLQKQIENLRKNLKTYPRKEKTLYDLLASEAVTKDYVLDAVNKLKDQRLQDERQLKLLVSSRDEATRSDRLTLRLQQASFYKLRDLVHKYDPQSLLYPYPNGLEHDPVAQLSRKRELFESIGLRVIADPTGYEFTFSLNGTIVSTKDTGRMSALEDELEAFEERNPNVSLKDYLESKPLLPEHSDLAEELNQLKNNLVTIEQTSA